MKIGIDVDDTITNSYDLILDFVSKEYNKDKQEIIDSELSYDDMMNDPVNFPNYLDYSNRILRDVVKDATIKENAVEIIKYLHELGHTIEIVTARHDEEYRDPYKFTETFLKKNNIYYDKINCNVHNKGIFCRENNFDLLIDDSLKHCRFAREEGVKTILIDNVFNRKDQSFVRANDWLDVLEIVRTNKF